MLTGRPPFLGATTLETLQQVLTDEPVPPRRLRPNLPRYLEIICLKCLEKVPRSRYATAADLAEDLRRFRAWEPVAARPAGMLRRAAKWARRRPVAAALVAVSLVAGLGLAGLSVWLWSALDRARDSEARIRRSLYAADLRSVSESYRYGDIQTMRTLLDLHAPSGGDEVGFEWRYWNRLLQEMDRSTVAAHEGEVLAVAFAPDGQTLATAGRDGRVHLWDCADFRRRATLSEAGVPILRLVFHDRGETLSGIDQSGAVRSWDPATGKERGQPFLVPYRSAREALSPDGQLLAAVGEDPRVVQVWERATRAPWPTRRTAICWPSPTRTILYPF